MAAEVIDLAEARKRLARSKPDPVGMEIAEWWYEDLERYPAAFQRRVRPHLEYVLSERMNPNQREFGIGMLIEKRLRRGGYSEEFFARQLMLKLRVIRRSASAARHLASCGRGVVEARQRHKLWSSKGDLLKLLFQFGYDRVPLVMLREMARTAIDDGYSRSGPQNMEVLAQKVETLRARVNKGVCINGPRKGLPLSQIRLGVLTQELEVASAGLERCRRYESRYSADPDPLRRWGMWG